MSPLKKEGAKIMVKSTGNRWMGLCVAAVIIITVMMVLPQAVSAQNATLDSYGNGLDIYSRYYGDDVNARIFEMNVSGTIYDSYCIDLFTTINIGDNLTINGSLAEGDPNINWTAVIYILNKYDYSTAGDKDLEAAAIQAAIWYYCTEEHGEYPGTGGKYQFMTDPQTGAYDGYFLDDPSAVRDRAFVIINDTKENGTDFKFPTTIELTSSEEYVLVNKSVNLTATVKDQDNQDISGVIVKFAITEGTGTLNPDYGTTNSSGQVQTNFTKTGDDNATTVVAWIEGNYGTLLRGDVLYATPKQNVSTITIIPHTIEDSIVLPVPELSTLVLMSTGLLALMGYVGYSRRRTTKK